MSRGEVVVRPIARSEVAEAQRLLAYNMNWTEHRPNVEALVDSFSSLHRCEWTQAAFAGDRMVAYVQWWPTAMRVHGRSIPFAIAGPGATEPDYRNLGIQRQVLRAAVAAMEEAQCLWAGLETDVIRWHRRNGWEVATEARTYVFRLSEVRFMEPETDVRVRRVDGPDPGTFANAYRTHFGARNATIDRTDDDWRRFYTIASRRGVVDAAVIESPNGVRAYVTFLQGDASTSRPTQVLELVWTTRDEYLALWHYLQGHNVLDDVEWCAPSDDPLRRWVVEPTAVRVEQRIDKMLRILDVEEFLRAMPPPESSHPGDSFVLGVEDRFLPKNNCRWRVAVEDQRVQIERCSSRPDLQLPVGEVAPTLLASPAHRAHLLRLLEGLPQGTSAAIDRFFSCNAPAYCVDDL